MRAAWNRIGNIFAGPAFGGALKIALMPYRLVRRDESAGLGKSPPFYAWVTCPIGADILGCQSEPMGAFHADQGDVLFDDATGSRIGVVLWCETWLPGTPTNYQRIYVANVAPIEDGSIELAFTLDAYDNTPPAEDSLMAVAFTMEGDVPAPPSTDGALAVAFTMEGDVPPGPSTDGALAVAFTMEGDVPAPPSGDGALAVAFNMEGDV